MKTKNKFKFLIVLMFSFFLLALASCGGSDEPTTTTKEPAVTTTVTTTGGGQQTTTKTPAGEVSTPTNLKAENGKVTWGRVSGATSYDVEVNGETKTVKFTNFDLLTLTNLPKDGKFEIKVKAKNDGNESAWTNAISYTFEGETLITPTVSGISGTTISWNQITATSFAGIAEPYPVIKIGSTENKLDKNASSFDLASVTTDSDISLYYVGDGVYNKTSGAIKLRYTVASKSLAFGAPTNVYMDGDILKFDEVIGANIYYLKDVYNTITTISGNEILNLSSDRDGHFLIKEIWAGNTDLDIMDSSPTEVTYFTSAEGDGSENNPFIISTPTHLRFIEYYEALGEAKYYKLANDISFKEYTPEIDEDYSNFYNLGSLSGVLDGDNHSLKNIVVYYKDGYSSIFDNITETGVIKNLKIENTNWRTWTNRTNDGIMHEKGGECSILAYTNRGLISNVTLVSGIVTAVKDGASGLASINRGTIENCKVENEFEVYGENEAGGFAIYNVGLIKNCINYGYISGSSTIGGIAGRNAGTILECGNEGTITADIYGGGIVGYNYNIKDTAGMQYDTLIKACYNLGSVTSTAYAGGIAGRNGSDGINELGVTKVANAGILGCYNQGTISGIISVAGIAGENYGYYGGTEDGNFGIRACYSTGDINYNVDGFVANRIYLCVNDCSWAEVDSPDIRVHMWKGEGGSDYSTSWPGTSMKKTQIGSTDFYYIDLPTSIRANELSGLIFNRVNPIDSSEVFNQTVDITAIASGDTGIYYVDSNWSTARLVEPCAGAIAGYNNMVNNCYYATGAKIGGTQIPLSAVKTGTAQDTVSLVTADLRAVYTALNEVLGDEIFVAKENEYPILKWQGQ